MPGGAYLATPEGTKVNLETEILLMDEILRLLIGSLSHYLVLYIPGGRLGFLNHQRRILYL